MDAETIAHRKRSEQEQFVDILGEENPDEMLLDETGDPTDDELKDPDDQQDDFVPMKSDVPLWLSDPLLTFISQE